MYVNVLKSSLEIPPDIYVIECLAFERCCRACSSFNLHTLHNILRQLGTKRENFALLLTEAACCISLAGETLNELYPFVTDVTCIAHLQHNCAMRVRILNIDDVVARAKAATIKKKISKKIFMKIVCHHLLTLYLQDGQLDLELHCTTKKLCCCWYYCQRLGR